MQNICAKRTRASPRITTVRIATAVTRQMEEERREALTELAAELIKELSYYAPHIMEGDVMTIGPAPYRRLDCDRRALAYVRARPRKGMVRIDVSGLWRSPRDSRLAEQGATGSATLILRTRDDKAEAIAYLLATVEETRAYHAKRRAEEAEL